MKIVLSRGLELLGVPDGCPNCPLSMVRQIHKYNTFNGIGKTTLLLFCFALGKYINRILLIHS